MARRLLAGAFLAFIMALTFAGVASAQSNSNSNSNSNTNTNSSTSSSSPASSSSNLGSVTPRTGAEMWIPLTIGGLVVTVAIATRLGLARAASRLP